MLTNLQSKKKIAIFAGVIKKNRILIKNIIL